MRGILRPCCFGLALVLSVSTVPGATLASEDLAALEAVLGGSEEGAGPPAAPAATTAVRDARLWLDDDYRITAPPLPWFEGREDSAAWREWVDAVTLTPSFVAAFTGTAWAGDIVHFDFEQPRADGLTWAGQDAGIPVLDWGLNAATRAVLATGQTLRWAFDRTRLPPAGFVENWFYPHDDGDVDDATPTLVNYVGWIARLPVWEDRAASETEAAARAVALPLDAGATLLLAQPLDLELDSAADWQALHSAMEPRWVELQVPFFEGWISNQSVFGERAIDTRGLIALNEAVEVATRHHTWSGLRENGFAVSTLALAEIALPKPPPMPSGNNGSVDYSFLVGPWWDYFAPPLDFVLNQPFRWALFDRSGRLVASGAVSEAHHLERAPGSVDRGWHESLWFGRAWRQDRRSELSWPVLGEETDDSPDSPDNWRYHATHGWLWLDEPRAAGMWYWDNGLESWSWTNAAVHPWMYRHGRGWAFFLHHDGVARWFYFAEEGTWARVPD